MSICIDLFHLKNDNYVNYKEDPTIDYVKKNKPDTEKEIAFLSYKIHNFINYM